MVELALKLYFEKLCRTGKMFDCEWSLGPPEVEQLERMWVSMPLLGVVATGLLVRSWVTARNRLAAYVANEHAAV